MIRTFGKKHNISIKKLCQWVGLPESSFHFAPTGKPKGGTPTTATQHNTKGFVPNTEVLTSIKDILVHEFIDCGYRAMTAYLQNDGYKINHKKVYRLMGDAGLLKPSKRIQRRGSGRKFVRFRNVQNVCFKDKRFTAYFFSLINNNGSLCFFKKTNDLL